MDTLSKAFDLLGKEARETLTREQIEATEMYALGLISFSQFAATFDDVFPMYLQTKRFHFACTYAEVYSAKHDSDMNKANI